MEAGGFIFDDKKDVFVRESYCAPFKSTFGSNPVKLAVCANHQIFGDNVDARVSFVFLFVCLFFRFVFCFVLCFFT